MGLSLCFRTSVSLSVCFRASEGLSLCFRASVGLSVCFRASDSVGLSLFQGLRGFVSRCVSGSQWVCFSLYVSGHQWNCLDVSGPQWVYLYVSGPQTQWVCLCFRASEGLSLDVFQGLSGFVSACMCQGISGIVSMFQGLSGFVCMFQGFSWFACNTCMFQPQWVYS